MNPRPQWRQLLLRAFLVLLFAYAIFGIYIWRAMRRPPEQFGRVMSHMPEPAVFMIFPFETLWMRARAGTLHIGDPAPDFSLVKLDKTDHIQLSSFAAQHRPVVLIFGSYT